MITMLPALDAPHLTWLFLATISALATAFVWMFCVLDRRFGKRPNPAAPAFVRDTREAARRRD